MQVRNYAVDVLKDGDDEHIEKFLNQLAQALKFENIRLPDEMQLSMCSDYFSETKGDSENCGSDEQDLLKNALLDLLISRASKNFKIANGLNWFFKYERQLDEYSKLYSLAHDMLMCSLRSGDRTAQYFYETLSMQGDLVNKIKGVVDEMKSK